MVLTNVKLWYKMKLTKNGKIRREIKLKYEIGKNKKDSVLGDWENFCDALLDAMCVCESPVKYTIEENEVHNKHDKG